MRVLVKNSDNNMGDAMCQMTGLKEYRERNPDAHLDFLTCHYLHYIIAKHTDLFDNITFNPDRQAVINAGGYDSYIDFKVDWGEATVIGILKAWTKKTLGFVPSTDQPYFLLTEEEKLTAQVQLKCIMYECFNGETELRRYRKSVVIQPEAVSDPRRSFRPEDLQTFFNLFPDDVAIIYFCPVTKMFRPDLLSTRKNFFALPGYPIGTSAAMMQLVDAIFTVHSGTAMLAKAVDAPMVHINFLEASSPNIITVPKGDNIGFESNQKVDWELLKKMVAKYL